jgi:hypothetical protein
MMDTPKMKPIWYFVGLLLLVMGVLILAAGLYQLIRPPQQPTVLARLHPGIWWGGIMILGGVIFLFTSGNQRER